MGERGHYIVEGARQSSPRACRLVAESLIVEGGLGEFLNVVGVVEGELSLFLIVEGELGEVVSYLG